MSAKGSASKAQYLIISSTVVVIIKMEPLQIYKLSYKFCLSDIALLSYSHIENVSVCF